MPTAASRPTPRPASVTANIPIEYPGGLAVLGESIFAARHPGVIERVDAVTGAVTATIPSEYPSLVVSDGVIWTLDPIGEIPGPEKMTIGRLDLDANRVITIGQIARAWSFSVGLGAIWVSRQDRLDKLSQRDASLISSWPWPATWANEVFTVDAVVACGALWVAGTVYSADPGLPPTTILSVLDPASGRRLAQYSYPTWADEPIDAAGGCWTVLGGFETGDALRSSLARLDPANGQLERSPELDAHIQIAADTFWTWTVTGEVQQINPHTGRPVADPWQIPVDLVPPYKGVGSLRLFTAGGHLWLANPGALVRLDVPIG